MWRIRFRDDRWLDLVVLLEFQATVDSAMALRMLTYTALLYQRLDADGVLRDHGALPPVLPVVLYNGRGPWTAPVEMTDLVAAGSDLLAPYQPSQRYYLLDGARVAGADLPADNLVSALIALEKTRDPARLRDALQALGDLLRAQGDDHLTRAFVTWLRQGLRFAGRLPAGEGGPAGPSCRRRRRCWKRPCGNGPVNGSSRASSRDAAKSGRCSAVWRRGSSMPSPPSGWPPPSPASPTPTVSRGSATGSSSVPRRQSCSPASAATTGRAVEAPLARTVGGAASAVRVDGTYIGRFGIRRDSKAETVRRILAAAVVDVEPVGAMIRRIVGDDGIEFDLPAREVDKPIDFTSSEYGPGDPE